ncbi:DUF732 domain-containing protein [Kocuria arenosa]|uniref:DUF732 domain-containing protein n=1 Tax=Kocuria arenosa TaxID=3071446 RepID=UPI0034D43FAB
MSQPTSSSRARRRAFGVAFSALILLSLTACGTPIERGEKAKAENAERDRVRENYVTFMQASTSPGLVMLNDDQLLAGGERVCRTYDDADTDDNVLLNFVSGTRAGGEVLPGLSGKTTIFQEAAVETVGAATSMLCPQYEERAQLEAEEMDLMDYTL